jgi:aryl-alcohol dehydrogenase-like predicted oxidoreductase
MPGAFTTAQQLCTVVGVERRPLGQSGLSLSAVGLGGVELGPFEGELPDQARAVAVIEAAISCGINWIDTSENYLHTKNESVIGDALAQVGSEFLVSTKVAPGAAISGGGTGFRREQVRRACHESLCRLRREHIDVYFLHWPDESGVPIEETWGAMTELAEEGLVRAIGLSNYSIESIERCHAQRRVDAIQDGLNLIDYLENRELFRRCGELGIAGTAYDSLSSSVLTDRTRDEVFAAWEVYAAHGWTHPLLAPDKVERTYSVVDALRPIAARLGATVAQVAIAWILRQSGVTAALAGTRSPDRVRENAGGADLDISDARDEIESLIPLGPAFA